MSSKSLDQFTLRGYRAGIRAAWLPIVGRRKLRSFEYELTEQWFAAGIPLNLILKAIKQVGDRAKSSGVTVYSLGVISADLEQLRRKSSTAEVGAHSKVEGNWREQWAEDLEVLAEGANNPEFGSMCKELLRDLPGITLDQAKARWREIQRQS